MTRAQRRSALALTAFALALGVLPVALSAQSTAPLGDAKHGQTVFLSEGCYECHGYQGEGTGSRGPGGVAPNLAPHPIPYVAFVAQLRRPRERMPVYGTRILSDQAAADIYAFLVSIPTGKRAAAIPALGGIATTPAK